MQRRAFVSGLALEVLLAAAPARGATDARVYRIGMLEPIPEAQNRANLDALRTRLRELGYVEGTNLVIEYRSADGHAERFPQLAAELVRRRVDVVIARGTPAARAIQQATATIPVVMATMGDPGGLVASYARPGGNITGVTTFTTELMGKRVELLKELVPDLARIALLHNMGNPAVPPEWQETRSAAQRLGIEAVLLDVRSDADLSRALDSAASRRVQALVVGADAVTQAHRQQIVDWAARNRVPASYPAREFVDAGGLLAYAVSYPDVYGRFAEVVDKLLKGAKPGDLPVERPARLELVVNLKAADALGLAVPQSLLLRADRLIR